MGLRRSINGLVRLSKKLHFPKVYSALPGSSSAQETSNTRAGHENSEKHTYNKKSTPPTIKQTAQWWKTLFGLLLVFFIAIISLKTPFKDSDLPQCRSVYMYPSYAKINGFDAKHTRLYPKYHLYLYREQGTDTLPIQDNEIQLDGIPVLFIPGNAGSFKQGRSLAASSADLYYHHHDQLENSIENTRNLDFFLADFNEDFTAFHGRTMLDQAEYLNDAIKYILSLYSSSQNTRAENYGPLPQSVIVVGHSMGGIVARVMHTLDNYVPKSVNTVITLSSPHSLSPVTFDGDILKVYAAMNNYWTDKFQNDPYYIENVSVISITGGILDDVLPADYTNIEPIVFRDQSSKHQNGFTVYTSSIPGVWTSIDHLAMVWCDQLRKVLANTLLEVVDKNVPSKTRPLSDRMHTFRNKLLSGFEADTFKDLNILKHNYTEQLSYNTLYSDAHIVTDRLEIDGNKNVNPGKFVLETSTMKESQSFNVLLSTKDSTRKPELLFCKKSQLNEDGSEYVDNGDVLDCASASADFKSIPNSKFDILEKSSYMNENGNQPFYFLTLNSTTLSEFTHIVIKHEETSSPDDMLLATAEDGEFQNFKTNFFSLLFKEIRLVATKGKLVSNFKFLKLQSSALSLKIKIEKIEGANTSFRPILKQYIDEPFETKWHILEGTKSAYKINTHNILPYVPFEKYHDRALKLQLIKPFDSDVVLSIGIDWGYTLKLLLLRYRLAAAAIPMFVATLLLLVQITEYKKKEAYISMKEAMYTLLSNHFSFLMLLSVVLTPLCTFQSIQTFLKFIAPSNLVYFFHHEDFVNNPFYLGINHWEMIWLGPILLCMSISLVYLSISLVDLLELGFYQIYLKLGKVNNEEEIETRSPTKLQLCMLLLLLYAVLFWIPFQLAFVIEFMLQVHVCMKFARNLKNKHFENLRNYNKSLVVVFIFIIPINVPTIIVFFHNFAIKWNDSFSSHHNVLAILPIMILVYMNSSGRILKHNNKTRMNVLASSVAFMSVFSIVYGVRHCYFLYYLLNLVCCCVLLNVI